MVNQITHQTPPRSNVRFDRMMPNYHDRLAERGEAQVSNTPAKLPNNFFSLAVKTTGFLVISATIIFAAAHLYGKMITSDGNSDDPRPLELAIGQDRLAVPTNMIRFKSQRNSTELSRLDLHLHWPSMQGYTKLRADLFNNMAKDNSAILLMTIEPRKMRKDMSGRVNLIYKASLTGQRAKTNFGLVQQNFSHDSPFARETLYMEANSPYPYATRCQEGEAKEITPTCLRDIQIGKNLMVTYRFDRALLPQWLQIDRAIHKRLSMMLRK